MKAKNLSILFLAVALYGCDCFLGFIGQECDDCADCPNYDAILYADFTNNGNTQALILNETKTDGPIQIENQVTLNPVGSRYNFVFSGVTFLEGENVFEVNKIVSEKFEENRWQVDSENFLDYEPSKSLSLVLVLDVSSSLGDNLDDVKNSARQVLNQIFKNNPNAKVAIVKFSRGNLAHALSSNEFELSQFIAQQQTYSDSKLGGGSYQLENKNETALYEAMLKGIEILNNSNSRGQGLITFTDGANNFQFDPNNDDRQVVINALKQSSIRSYTVGFIGNADEVNSQALNDLSIGGKFSKPASITELNLVFTSFSNSVGAVYDLIYDTNNGPFNGSKPYRFLIDLDHVN
ncbi:VWA domain-containing protein [Algoriphagus sp. H41]|uniref:VWA domain-containing protein n=1 Tax=Algoriphagus oliviformis TaxID=2811231 RepID=A0ABS3C0W0_9BACT|nr:vWA domain-containing protein [Algoriphagus oliviformis]MBN7810557.1 VWA domain-containing protein [Algoriphagus oliviformis]